MRKEVKKKKRLLDKEHANQIWKNREKGEKKNFFRQGTFLLLLKKSIWPQPFLF